MLATAHDSELFAYLRQHVEPTDIEDETARSLFVYLEDAYRHDESLKRGLLDRIDDESLRELVLLKLTTGEFGGWTRHDLERATKLIRVRKLEAEQHRLEMEMKRAGASNPHLLQDLLSRKMGVDQELSELKVRAND
jgi:DNA primase